MTSSDRTRLPADARARASARVGTSIGGEGALEGAGRPVAGAPLRVGLACAEFNGGITDRLLTGALDALEEAGCDLDGSAVVWAPGAFELPLVAQQLARSGAVDAVICLGAVIRGDTGHYDFVAGECAAGLRHVQLETGVPTVFGVLTTDTVDQALMRSEPDSSNKGREAALTALHTVAVLAAVGELPAASPVGFAAPGPLMLRLVLPKGSLERATLELFAAADLAVNRSSEVDYRAAIGDPRVDEVRILRPQEIPLYVADGLFDVGITGRDWIEERGSEVESLGILSYSKATSNPIRVVLAVSQDSPVSSVGELAASVADHGGVVRVATEYPGLTGRYLERHGVKAEVSLSYGATEAKVPDIADCVVEITETGRALRAAGLKIIETLLVSHTEFIANPLAAADPEKRHAMEQLLILLQGALEARDKVLVKLNVTAEQLPAVIELLPSLRSPTVSELFGGGGFAVETVVRKAEINVLIPALKDRGATDIIELSLSKIVH